MKEVRPSDFVLMDGVPDTENLIRVMEIDLEGAEPENPRTCVLAKAARRAGFLAWIHRHIAWVVQPATRELIRYNKEVNGITGVKVGDLVRVRYRLSQAALDQVHGLDNGNGFQLGYYYFRAPSVSDLLRRDRANSGRRGRYDGKRKGQPISRNLHRASASQDSLETPLTNEDLNFLGL